MESLLESCEGGLKWHWYSVMDDLRKAGLEDVIIEPIPLGPNCFPGTYKQKMFVHSWWKDTFLLVSMRAEERSSSELKELVDAPVAALQGVSERQAQLLFEGFKVKTIGDLANLKFFHWAQSIVSLANTEE